MNQIALKRLLLALAVFAVFGQSLLHDFVDWDDGILIYHNANFNPPTASGLLKHWTPSDPSNDKMYNPMVYTTWWLLSYVAQLDTPDALGAKLNPIVFHAANLVVHLMSALIVFELLRLLAMPDGAALAGAMVFAIHPIQTEVVAWATGMKDALSGLFALLALWRYVIAAKSDDVRQRRIQYLLATLAYIAALLAKPSTVVVPLMAAAIDLIFLRRSWRQTALWVMPWLMLAGAITVLAAGIQPTSRIAPVAIWARPLIAADALAFYLYKLVVPIHFGINYGRSPQAVFNDSHLHHPLYWSWLAPFAAAVVLWKLKKRELTLAGVLFVLGALPVLGLVPFIFQYHSTVADRYVYVSMLGVALAVAWIVARFGGRKTTIAVTCVCLLLAVSAFVQAGTWADTPTLWAYNLKMNPRDARGYLSFGQSYLAQADIEARAAAAAGNGIDRQQHLKARHDALELAAANFQKSIDLDPLWGAGYDQLSRTLIELGRPADAARVLQEAIDRYPRMNEADRQDLDALHLTLGMLYFRIDDYGQAITHFRESLKIKDDPTARKFLAEAQRKLGTSRPTSRGSVR